MRRYALFASLLAIGMGLGIPVGYRIGRSNPKAADLASDRPASTNIFNPTLYELPVEVEPGYFIGRQDAASAAKGRR